MKILIVASPWLGGSGTLAFELAEVLSNKHQTFFTSFDFPYRQRNSRNFIFFNTVPATYSLFPYPLYQTTLTERIVDLVTKYDINLINTHYNLIFGEAATTAKEILHRQGKKVKVVLTIHGTDAVGFTPENPGQEIFKNLSHWMLDKADLVTTPSHWMVDFIQKTYQTKRKIKIIPNFFDNEIFQKTHDFLGRKNFLHVSNFRKVKRPLEVVKAFQLFQTQRSGFGLTLVGEGPEKETIKEYIEQEKLDNINLKETANKEELKNLYNQSLALILPSSFENLPLTILEAAGCGTPTIATNVGGVKEAVLDKESGVLVNNIAQPATQVSQAMVRFTEESFWQKLSDGALKHSRKFSGERIVSLYEEAYEQILRSRNFSLIKSLNFSRS